MGLHHFLCGVLRIAEQGFWSGVSNTAALRTTRMNGFCAEPLCAHCLCVRMRAPSSDDVSVRILAIAVQHGHAIALAIYTVDPETR